MMTKNEVEHYMGIVIKECKLLKIPVSTCISPEIKINRRAKSRFACCKKQKLPRTTEFLIEIGEALLEADSKIVKGILAHEILHTCKGCYNHGARWKNYADQMNRAYDYNISTTTTYENLGLRKPPVKRQLRYTITCQKCGAQFRRQRKSKLVTHTSSYRCKCGGRLKCEDSSR